ncbi:hypothetical protein SAMN05443144_105193 [Fodinibius roseus]|uniref:Uncharacterized protein n=1 Tax=Fodinibius roseus TaxID=1194090 RepID=A0A1M4YY53_9BACT|nr:hypothetical protein SAMN05443144_105193 [Fodinibius roseus]
MINICTKRRGYRIELEYFNLSINKVIMMDSIEENTSENHSGLLALGVVFLAVGATFLATSTVSTWISWAFIVVSGIYLLKYLGKRIGDTLRG